MFNNASCHEMKGPDRPGDLSLFNAKSFSRAVIPWLGADYKLQRNNLNPFKVAMNKARRKNARKHFLFALAAKPLT